MNILPSKPQQQGLSRMPSSLALAKLESEEDDENMAEDQDEIIPLDEELNQSFIGNIEDKEELENEDEMEQEKEVFMSGFSEVGAEEDADEDDE